MSAPDLNIAAPRRWNVEVDGVFWLARLADKARAARSGSLGTYLYGQSPIDRSFLHALGCTHDEFAQAAVATASDAALASALQAYDPGLRRSRAWSHEFPKRWGWFLTLLDVDDGYRPVPLHGAVRFVADTISGLIKRVVPSDDRGSGPA